MSIFILLLLCLIQGLTEFLPVSSSGHLLFLEQVFNINGNLLLLNLFLHLATLIAVVIVYRKIIWKLLKKPFQPLTYKLIISTTITLVFALSYEYLNIDSIVTNVYGFCFLITAILLLITHRFQKNSSVIIAQNEIGIKSSVLVGIVQGLAVLPGISRSGSTICSLILCGNDEEKSAEYSFLLSIPIIIGGFVFKLIELNDFKSAFEIISPTYCLIAFLATFIIAFLSLKLTLKLLKKNKFIIFSIYLFLLSFIIICYNLFVI